MLVYISFTFSGTGSNSANDCLPQHTDIPLTNHWNTKIQLNIEIQNSVLDMVFYLAMITFVSPPLLPPPSSITKKHTIIANNVNQYESLLQLDIRHILQWIWFISPFRHPLTHLHLAPYHHRACTHITNAINFTRLTHPNLLPPHHQIRHHPSIPESTASSTWIHCLPITKSAAAATSDSVAGPSMPDYI